MRVSESSEVRRDIECRLTSEEKTRVHAQAKLFLLVVSRTGETSARPSGSAQYICNRNTLLGQQLNAPKCCARDQRRALQGTSAKRNALGSSATRYPVSAS